MPNSSSPHMSSPPQPSEDLNGKVTKLDSDWCGYGGFSDVDKGVLIGTSDYVAIKVLRGIHTKPGALEKTIKRLNREVIVWRALDHKNVLKFLGVCTDLYASPALISPLCIAGSVVEYVRAHPEVNLSIMILGIAEGLAYLHRKDVVHGDLKPSNILIDNNGDPVLCDFGRSKILGHGGFTTAFWGSSRYLAPELLKTHDLTKESDTYSFGMMGLELLTGKIPFHKLDNDAQIIMTILSGVHPAMELGAPPGSERTWSILEECWNQDPQSRVSMHVVVRRLR